MKDRMIFTDKRRYSRIPDPFNLAFLGGAFMGAVLAFMLWWAI